MILQTLELTNKPDEKEGGCYCYIKTLRIFDTMYAQEKTIICEQFFVEKPVEDILEASFIQIKE